MFQSPDKFLGNLITRLIRKNSLTREESRQAFSHILNNEVTDMHQGAFLAALTAKGETSEEVVGAWESIYNLDTAKVAVEPSLTLAENSGTGMDTFKTFNISTAASIVAAAGGIPMARHGSRALTSVCGTVDMAEALGVDVECTADVVARSIESSNLGLFNGMSPHIHPRALGRILSRISFGSTLNIAASLANPALPSIGVRGVYAKDMIQPVAAVMKDIGYTRALVVHGTVEHSDKGMDEASVCGVTHCAGFFDDNEISTFTIDPFRLGLSAGDPYELAPESDIEMESRRFAALLARADDGVRKDAVILNAGLIFLAAGKTGTLEQGIETACQLLEGGAAFKALESWVSSQNRFPEKGLQSLHRLVS
ncbi:MAG: anthranilate phosphoribosyltransferase [Desulfamplus sp.]|nr:anthranilate phosphoribosyltransferase [Desulfamplus sp.]